MMKEQTLIIRYSWCTSPNANNYDPNATVDNGGCDFTFDITWQVSNEETQNLNYSVYFVESGVDVNDTGLVGTIFSLKVIKVFP